MKAIILAAGKGVRMLPLTEDTHKVLIEINGKPFLYYLLTNLKEAGYNDFAIIVGYKKEMFPAFLEKYNFKAELIEQKEQLGTGHAVMQAREFCGDEEFVALNGDSLFSVEDLAALNKQDNFNYIIGKQMKGDVSKYGVLVTEGDKLVKLVEKPKEFVGNVVNIGLYKFTSGIWKALDNIKLSERGEYELVDAVTTLAREGRVKASKLKDYWLDLGCKEDIPKIAEFLKSLK